MCLSQPATRRNHTNQCHDGSKQDTQKREMTLIDAQTRRSRLSDGLRKGRSAVALLKGRHTYIVVSLTIQVGT